MFQNSTQKIYKKNQIQMDSVYFSVIFNSWGLAVNGWNLTRCKPGPWDRL